MARKKTPKVRVNVKASLSRRLREVRQELFGEHGGPELARRLGLPARTWYNYETGVTVPAEVLLAFIEQTGANPAWLLSGDGPKYLRSGVGALTDLTPIELIRRGLEKLEQTPPPSSFSNDSLSGSGSSEFVPIRLVGLRDLARKPLDRARANGQVMAFRHWVPNPEETVGVRLDDDTMNPILPPGSVVAVDRSVNDPQRLQGQIVAACPEGQPVIRWLDVSERHLIFRPNQPTRDHPLIPIELDRSVRDLIIGQVVCSWSKFNES
ncbi:S24 family peptidase [Singulisphaera rosea]